MSVRLTTAEEHFVVVFDMGRSMKELPTEKRQELISIIHGLIEAKIAFSPKDNVALVTVGTKDTQNYMADLEREANQHDPSSQLNYRHITLDPLRRADVQHLRSVAHLEPFEGAKGDILDGLLLAYDVLHNKAAGKNVGGRILLVSDGQGSMRDRMQLKEFVKGMKTNGWNFCAVLEGYGGDPEDVAAAEELLKSGETTEKRDQELVLWKLCNKLGGDVFTVDEAVESAGRLRGKASAKRTSFRGVLNFGNRLHIPVWTFVRTERSLPLALKARAAAATDHEAEEEMPEQLARQTLKFDPTAPDVPVGDEERVRAYYYGHSTVPVPPDTADLLSWPSEEKSMRVLGFAKTNTIPPWWHLSRVSSMFHKPGDPKAAAAFNALVKSMVSTDRVLLIRWVSRKSANPKVCVAHPQISKDGQRYRLDIAVLPFSQDTRDWTFPSLAHRASKSASSITAVDDVIESLTLHCSRDEMDCDESAGRHFPVSNMYNPYIQYAAQTCSAKATVAFDDSIQDAAALYRASLKVPAGPPDAKVLKLARPTEGLGPLHTMHEAAKPALEALATHFPIVQATAATTKPWFDADVVLGAAAAAQNDDTVTVTGTELSFAPVIKGDKVLTTVPGVSSESGQPGMIGRVVVTRVGTATPVEDFLAMMRDKAVDRVKDAISGMCEVILRLVRDSIRDSHYLKALKCLEILRMGCREENEGIAFNDYLTKLRHDVHGPRSNFWDNHVVKAGITLLTHDDCPSVRITEAEAREFLFGAGADVAEEPLPSVPITADDDDLYNSLE